MISSFSTANLTRLIDQQHADLETSIPLNDRQTSDTMLSCFLNLLCKLWAMEMLLRIIHLKSSWSLNSKESGSSTVYPVLNLIWMIHFSLICYAECPVFSLLSPLNLWQIPCIAFLMFDWTVVTFSCYRSICGDCQCFWGWLCCYRAPLAFDCRFCALSFVRGYLDKSANSRFIYGLPSPGYRWHSDYYHK